MSWKLEFKDEGKWISNALRFATEKEANDYRLDLTWRWLGAPSENRVIECDDAVNYTFDTQKGAQPIGKAA